MREKRWTAEDVRTAWPIAAVFALVGGIGGVAVDANFFVGIFVGLLVFGCFLTIGIAATYLSNKFDRP